jgi:hypothetical protein
LQEKLLPLKTKGAQTCNTSKGRPDNKRRGESPLGQGVNTQSGLWEGDPSTLPKYSPFEDVIVEEDGTGLGGGAWFPLPYVPPTHYPVVPLPTHPSIPALPVGGGSGGSGVAVQIYTASCQCELVLQILRGIVTIPGCGENLPPGDSFQKKIYTYNARLSASSPPSETEICRRGQHWGSWSLWSGWVNVQQHCQQVANGYSEIGNYDQGTYPSSSCNQ